jgi:hypothetical protein
MNDAIMCYQLSMQRQYSPGGCGYALAGFNVHQRARDADIDPAQIETVATAMHIDVDAVHYIIDTLSLTADSFCKLYTRAEQLLTEGQR